MEKKDRIKKVKKKIKEFFIESEEDDLEEKQVEVKLVGFKLREVIILISIATIIGVLSGSLLTYNFAGTTHNSNNKSSNTKYINEFQEAFDNVVDQYYKNLDKDELIDAAIDGMLSTLDDYTSYMTPEETEQFNITMNGKYQGIGIEFVSTADNVHTIINVFDNTPAKIAGIQKKDVILKIDNKDASTMTGTEIASYIKSENVKEVTMVVKRNDEDLTLKISKALINIPYVSKKTFNYNGKKVGYINIGIFSDNAYDQFKDALTSLESENITSLIIDVRNNSGGYLHTADDIIELFLQKGMAMYQIKDRNSTTKYKDQTDEHRTYPVTILINSGSASASEILASAFKEEYNSQIIGTTSYGKGTVQQPTDLMNGGMIKVTTDEWLTPKGNTINKVGVSPTIELKLNDDYQTNPTDENDNQLQKALEVLAK
jgi:carboxyl-terminal processing protease